MISGKLLLALIGIVTAITIICKMRSGQESIENFGPGGSNWGAWPGGPGPAFTVKLDAMVRAKNDKGFYSLRGIVPATHS